MGNTPLNGILGLWRNPRVNASFERDKVRGMLERAYSSGVRYDTWMLSMFKGVDEGIITPREFDMLHSEYEGQDEKICDLSKQLLRKSISMNYPQFMSVYTEGVRMEDRFDENGELIVQNVLDEDYSIKRSPVVEVVGSSPVVEEKSKSNEEKSGGELCEKLINGRWRLIKGIETKFDDVVGLEDVKEEITNRIVRPYQHPELAREYDVKIGGGILLYGPPGTGKTTLAKSIAGQIESNFFLLESKDFYDPKSNDNTIEALADLFEVLKEHEPSVVFMDEVDSMAPRRDGPNCGKIQKNAINYILTSWDGFGSSFEDRKIFWVGATNLPWELDSAFIRPGRLSPAIYVGYPGPEGLAKTFEIGLRRNKVAEDVDFEKLGRDAEGFSGADIIENVITKAKDRAFKKAVDGEPKPISMRDLEESIKGTSISRDEKYSQKMNEFRGVEVAA